MSTIELFERERSQSRCLNVPCEFSSCTLHLCGGDADLFLCDGKEIKYFNNRDDDNKLKNILRASLHTILSGSCRKVTIIKAGVSIVAFGCSDSTVWTIGLNTVNPTVKRSALEDPKLQLISTDIAASHIAVGYSHVLIVDTSGVLYALGRGHCGQLGIGHRCEWVDTPTHVPVTRTAYSHCCSHSDDGVHTSIASPLRSDCEAVVQAAAGSLHSAVVTTTGRVYCFGCGANGRLGLGATDFQNERQVGITGEGAMGWGIHSNVSSGNGVTGGGTTTTPATTDGHEGRTTRLHDDDDALSPSLVSELEGVGSLRSDGTSSGVLMVACGVWHTVAVAKDTHDVYVWGWCRYGQSGSIHEELLPTPRRVSQLDIFLLAPRADDITSLTPPTSDIPIKDNIAPAEDEAIADVCCGSRFTAIRTTSSRLIVMGQLGVQDESLCAESCSGSCCDFNEERAPKRPRLEWPHGVSTFGSDLGETNGDEGVNRDSGSNSESGSSVREVLPSGAVVSGFQWEDIASCNVNALATRWRVSCI